VGGTGSESFQEAGLGYSYIEPMDLIVKRQLERSRIASNIILTGFDDMICVEMTDNGCATNEPSVITGSDNCF